jgi:hypothetical protein
MPFLHRKRLVNVNWLEEVMGKTDRGDVQIAAHLCGICFYVCPEPGAITVRIRKREEAAVDEAEHVGAMKSGGGGS